MVCATQLGSTWSESIVLFRVLASDVTSVHATEQRVRHIKKNKKTIEFDVPMVAILSAFMPVELLVFLFFFYFYARM